MNTKQATLPVPVAVRGPTSDSAWCEAARRAQSHRRLRKRQIIRAVSVLHPAQATYLGPIYELAQRATAYMFGQYSVVVAVWPDGVAAVIPLDPSQWKPTANQLVRAYHAARNGVPLFMDPNDTDERELPCPKRTSVQD